MVTCAGCGCVARPGALDEHNFAGEKHHRFWICCDVCYWVVAMRRAREEAGMTFGPRPPHKVYRRDPRDVHPVDLLEARR